MDVIFVPSLSKNFWGCCTCNLQSPKFSDELIIDMSKKEEKKTANLTQFFFQFHFQKPKIFLSLRFYVKLILEIQVVQIQPFFKHSESLNLGVYQFFLILKPEIYPNDKIQSS